MSEHVRIPIDGMTCSSCVGHIVGAVRKLEGIESVKVDLGTDSATVAFDPARTSLVAIGAAVERAGFEPHLGEAEPAVAKARSGFRARFGLGH